MVTLLRRGVSVARTHGAEFLKHPRKRLRLRKAVGLVLAGGFAQFDQPFGQLGSAHHSIEHRNAQVLLQLVGEVGESCTTQKDSLRVVLFDRPARFCAQSFQTSRRIALDVENIKRGGTHTSHFVTESVSGHHLLYADLESWDNSNDRETRRQ